MRTVALILALLAGASVLSLLIWTVVGWARSDRARAERRQREQNGEGEV